MSHRGRQFKDVDKNSFLLINVHALNSSSKESEEL